MAVKVSPAWIGTQVLFQGREPLAQVRQVISARYSPTVFTSSLIWFPLQVQSGTLQGRHLSLSLVAYWPT